MEQTVKHRIDFTGNGEDFSATSEAEAWAREHGFQVGFMCREHPRGLVRGASYIAKWTNLTDGDKARLDGLIQGGDHRHGPVRILLYIDL